ncbi:MAG: gliding motility-associated C-terminal domain-containing protein [Candidatus Handelsmanbacteria bacterium]|nr:gliding motility-associated C-terminal domain-containing protein [Candidatus Handelsmanbacteria bacterium]
MKSILWLWCCCCWAVQAGALTIYRIGGEDLPPPDPGVQHQFVQLSWNDVAEKDYGEARLLTVTPEAIAPLQLDPTVNLTPTLIDRGGQFYVLEWTGWEPKVQDNLLLFDGDPETAYLGDGHFAVHGPAEKNMFFEFGGPFPIRRVRFFPRQQFTDERFLERFRIGVNDGDPLKDGLRGFRTGGNYGASVLDFDIAYDVRENTRALIDVELPPEPVQRLFFQAPENTRGIWEIAEFEIYGEGYVPAAGYISNIIDLGDLASLGSLTWGGRQDAGARVELSMRSGDDDEPSTYWRYTFRGDERTRFDAKGRPLNLTTYTALEKGEKAGITHDTENWDFWSPAYDFAAFQGAMAASRPRRYVQLKADFLSNDHAGGQVDYLQFSVSIPPLATEVLAEIGPQVAPAGAPTAFTYRLKPSLNAGDLGFDTIEIDTPARPVGVDAVRVGGQPVAFTVVRLDDRGLAVRLPPIDLQATEELVEVDFRAEVYEFGTIFSGRVANSARPQEVAQGLTPGDADELTEGAALRVDLETIDGRAIQGLRLIPTVFTPNGDGANDQVWVEYDLLNLAAGVPVRLEVFDLSGRLRAKVFAQAQGSGHSRHAWDGTDGEGHLLEPGLYVVRLTVEADRGSATSQALVALAY